MNMDLSREGLRHEYGLGLGLSKDGARVRFGSGAEADLSTKMIAYTSAASDARMGGVQLPAMSNSGSGNQGITASVPASVAAEQVKADRETRVRALTLSHLTAIRIHAFLPILSAFCAADTAAMGAAVAIVYLMGHDYNVAARAVQNMAGDANGMICDGAGCSCAMKVASSVSSMYRCVNLAMQGTVIPSSNGMVRPDIDETIRGKGKLGTTGMRATDFLLRILHRGLAEERDYAAGYAGHSDKRDRELVSSPYFIRRKGRIVGMLCINTDQSALEDFLAATPALQRYFLFVATGQFNKRKEPQPQRIEHDEAERPVQENLSASVDGMGERVIAAMVAKTGRQPDHFNSSERLSIIRDLDESGYFMRKETVSVIARRLELADSSIYRYLHSVRRT